MRNDRRRATQLKLLQRKRLMRQLGLQGGCVYARHREKITLSTGYMRTGNVSHYISTYPRRKTRSRDRFGSQRIAIEVFPSRKHLIDNCDVYHLWILPKDFALPFGIHPTRDPQGTPVNRGYDFSVEDSIAWTESEERKQLLAQSDDPISELMTTILG